MAIYVKTDEQGFPIAFFDTSFYDYDVPSGSIEITNAQHEELLSFQGQRRIVNGQVVEYTPPAAPIVTVLPSVTLWERMSPSEAEQVEAAMATQPFRTRQIFLTANTFRSDHELWPLLMQMATDLFGEERAAELLAAA
nr:hypothetical protein [Brucella intermedia]